MLKKDELADPTSCFNKATDNEIVFVLLERDEAMATTIEFWANERIRLGIDREDSPKIVGARGVAYTLRLKRFWNEIT